MIDTDMKLQTEVALILLILVSVLASADNKNISVNYPVVIKPFLHRWA
jgi:hypothetical protein